MQEYVNHALELDPSVKQMTFRKKKSIKSVFQDVKAGRKPPLAPKNLLEDTDGLRRPL